MSESSETGGQLAWRLLATLEGGTLVVAASAMLAHMARARMARLPRRPVGPIETVLISNASSQLGSEISNSLQSHGCLVIDGADSGATSDAASEAGGRVDALVVIGAEPKADGLEGLAALVSDDVYANLKSLETLSKRVKSGGTLAWAASTGEADSGAFSGAGAAFDDLLRSQLEIIANASQCNPVWIGRHNGVEQTTTALTAALLQMASSQVESSRFSVRNLAVKLSGYLWRWLKIVS